MMPLGIDMVCHARIAGAWLPAPSERIAAWVRHLREFLAIPRLRVRLAG